MSMAKCKCDKIFDSDEQLNYDEKGDCCCDNCYEELLSQFELDFVNIIKRLGVHLTVEGNLDIVQSIVESLMDKGYRKIK